MSRYMCNLVVPGAAKSGTSALHEMLDAHPRVQMSSTKEPHYFSEDEIHENGVNWHNSLFSNQGGVILAKVLLDI